MPPGVLPCIAGLPPPWSSWLVGCSRFKLFSTIALARGLQRRVLSHHTAPPLSSRRMATPSARALSTSEADGGACLGEGDAASESAVVEVERKLFLTAGQCQSLRSSLSVRGEKSFWDVYYDGPGYPLTTQDWWLRQRGRAWELKVPWTAGQALAATQSYEEVADEGGIARRLLAAGLLGEECASAVPSRAAAAGISECPVGLETMLAEAGIVPFAKLYTERVSAAADAAALAAYGVTSLQLDMDIVTYDAAFAESSVRPSSQDLAPFVIAEVEVMAPKAQGAVDLAVASVDKFLASHGLQDAPKAHSKLIEYMLRFRPEHLEALGVAGVVPKEKLAKLKANVASRLRSE